MGFHGFKKPRRCLDMTTQTSHEPPKFELRAKLGRKNSGHDFSESDLVNCLSSRLGIKLVFFVEEVTPQKIFLHKKQQ